MLTIFAVPKPFVGHINTIQRNAIKSWTLLRPKCEILLIGDEPGTAEIAEEFGFVHHPEVERNEYGTPLVSSLFEIAQRVGKGNRMMYTNCDIIFMNDLIEALDRIEFDRFLIAGRRWNLDVTSPLDFSDGWETQLTRLVKQSGTLGSDGAIDYFAFPKEQYGSLKPLLIGRIGWDNWLIWFTQSKKITVIDVTPSLVAVHQNHDHSHISGGEISFRQGVEAQYNLKLIGGWQYNFLLAQAHWRLLPQGLTRPSIDLANILGRIQAWAVIRHEDTRVGMITLWIINPHGPIRNFVRTFRQTIRKFFQWSF